MSLPARSPRRALVVTLGALLVPVSIAVSAPPSAHPATTRAHSTARAPLTLAPPSATLAPRASQAFTATLGGVRVAVTWRVNGVVGGTSSSGRITAKGVYTAPAARPASGVATVRATTKSGRYSEVRVKLVPPPAPAPAPTPPPPGQPAPTMTRNPIDARQQTLLPFGARSHWLQPVRGYLDTPPASHLRNAIGVNFDLGPDDAESAEATARLLATSGVRRARVEIGWGEVDYADPSRLWRGDRFRIILSALTRNGIRPLILLNSNHGVPAPRRQVTFTLAAPAAAGARSVQLDAAGAALVIPRRSGLDSLTTYKAAEVIFTGVDAAGMATLSRPLPISLSAGPHAGSLLRYEPFTRPTRADGTIDPRFAQTLSGWLAYVGVVTREARDATGGDAFDVEVWNEMSFGSDFLDIDRYYTPAIDPNPGWSDDVTTDAILRGTIAWLRDPAHGVSGIGIGNGFASQRPWEAGSTSPAGLTAIDKHPYSPYRQFPRDSRIDGIRPVDALGAPDGVENTPGHWTDSFAPTYTALFPEYYLSGIQTENLVRDLSPLTTDIYGTPHGRLTAPPGGPAPEVWLTEVNSEGVDHVSPAALRRFQAKVMLRALLSFNHAGATAVHMFAARGFSSGEYGLVDPAFFAAVRAGAGAFPDSASGGVALDATRRMTAAIPDSAPITRPRRLALDAVGDYAGRTQFRGDGTPAHPALHDRDVASILPYQLSDDGFAVVAYVATRDLSRVHDAAAPDTDPRRYDLPPEVYRLELRGIERCPSRIVATDPLDGTAVPVTTVSCDVPRLTVELPLTDSPRVITLEGA